MEIDLKDYLHPGLYSLFEKYIKKVSSTLKKEKIIIEILKDTDKKKQKKPKKKIVSDSEDEY